MNELKRIIDNAEKIVFFGGAGVSTESGIPDFRGGSGLYRKKDEDIDVPPEDALSAGYLHFHPEKFFKYYRKNMLYPNAKPGKAHLALAELERRGKLTALITQNIDGLHSAAGNRNVIELHGSQSRAYCGRCGKLYPGSAVNDSEGVPKCACTGIIRPDIVLYGEELDGESMKMAAEKIREADVLIVGGTSLGVYPASSLVLQYSGKDLVEINRTPTWIDGIARLVITRPIGEVLHEAVFGAL